MWRRSIQTSARCSASSAAAAALLWRSLDRRSLSSGATSAVDSIIVRSLKEHYFEVSKMTPPPKVNPPAAYSIVKGALDRDGPVLRRTFKEEEISISVMRLANILPSGTVDERGDDSISQFFLHVDVSKLGKEKSIQFLCGLYPDAVGIHSVCLRPKVSEPAGTSNMAKYEGRVFQELDQKIRNALHIFIHRRGIDEKLFPFLQAWLYVKDHRNLMRWFKSVGSFINGAKP
ncbi:mitochondrial acidic protein MAM33-like [Curcuma longa]|uniref:mitochondrial acidic protein MAM33-like n=1 Tax=Curcuma longa TaxID=136217 RepID=UPI003D9E2486